MSPNGQIYNLYKKHPSPNWKAGTSLHSGLTKTKIKIHVVKTE